MPFPSIQAMMASTSAMTSGPIPSPGRRKRLWEAMGYPFRETKFAAMGSRPAPLAQGLMRHQHRTGEVVQDILGGAAENILAQARMAIGPHDDEVAAIVIGAAQQGVARVIAGGGNACSFHLDAMAGQGFGEVSAGDGA